MSAVTQGRTSKIRKRAIRVRLPHRAVAAEMDRIAPKEDGSRHNPEYIGRIRRGYTISKELQPVIDQAVANLESSLHTKDGK